MFDWKSHILAVSLLLGVTILPIGPPQPEMTAYATGVAPEKSTELGLYLSSQEAFAFLQAHPETLFIDTRDPMEVSMMGHPVGIDAIVPINIHSNVYLESRAEYSLVPNPDVMDTWSNIAADFGTNKDDVIIVTCGNGRRSALMVNKLVAEGYTNVWHIVDGYPGEESEYPDGPNTKNAWQLAGLPWGGEENLPGSAWTRLLN
ncbi:rhodanese-like domain-containing protein [Pseudooctadecabacter jejudonensis]|uniref:Rhodanese domain-containing protein n=1 Tax=Pseudooctadecabacter jejudonensis TaxID=1391910 RepID=A0A1Y5TJT3_9RHOB|nr:rhodanese-like domain-containing protein [Pseudooctadecabacter jejudonensis]SLN63619.1 hypothetical protein PSJ8397_03367 [Pseudooctadecabacter jejudonensis]